jgi:hypothetical protein
MIAKAGVKFVVIGGGILGGGSLGALIGALAGPGGAGTGGALGGVAGGALTKAALVNVDPLTARQPLVLVPQPLVERDSDSRDQSPRPTVTSELKQGRPADATRDDA